MDPKTNYAVVGLFVIALTLGMIASAIWIAGGGKSKAYKTYLSYMNEAVSGLNEQSPVKFNGVDVGYVASISLNPTNPQQVRLELKIEEDTPISASTRATLQSQGITGLTYVGLTAETVHAPPLQKLPHQPYPVIKSKPSLMFRLDSAVQKISDSIKGVTDDVHSIFSKENQDALTETLSNLKQTTAVLANNADDIQQAVKSAKNLLANADDASKKLPNIAERLDSTLTAATEVADNLRSLTKDAKLTLRAGSSTIDDISEQTLPAIQQILQQLKLTLANAQEISSEMVNNPSVLVRGKSSQTPGPGE